MVRFRDYPVRAFLLLGCSSLAAGLRLVGLILPSPAAGRRKAPERYVRRILFWRDSSSGSSSAADSDADVLPAGVGDSGGELFAKRRAVPGEPIVRSTKTASTRTSKKDSYTRRSLSSQDSRRSRTTKRSENVPSEGMGSGSGLVDLSRDGQWQRMICLV
jgi:hypothetical protein